MLLRRRIAPNAFMITGLIALVAANAGRMLLRHAHHAEGNLSDGLIGFCYGVAIAALLVWVVRGKRGQS